MARMTLSMRMPVGQEERDSRMSAMKRMVTSGTAADELDEGRAQQRG